jgi:hypothetical protein
VVFLVFIVVAALCVLHHRYVGQSSPETAEGPPCVRVRPCALRVVRGLICLGSVCSVRLPPRSFLQFPRHLTFAALSSV